MNTLKATITSIDESPHLSLIQADAAGEAFSVLMADTPAHNELLRIGRPLLLAFKETEVILSKGTSFGSTANVHTATVRSIERGAILSSVTLDYRGIEIVSLTATAMLDALGVSVGETLSWMIQPSEISLSRGEDGI